MHFTRTLLLTFLIALSAAPVITAQPRAVREARKHLEVKRYRAALESLEKVRGPQKNSDPIVRMRLVAWNGLREYDKVADVGLQWVLRNPKDYEMQVWVGLSLVDLAVAEGEMNQRAQGFCEEAMNRADAALAVEPMYAPAFELRAVSLVNLGRSDDALKYADMMVKKRPGNAAFRVVQARVLNWVGKPGLAIGELNEAAARFKESAAVRLERAAIHMTSNQRDEAVRALAEAVECTVMTEEDHRVAGELLWASSGRWGQWDEGLKTATVWSRAHKESGRAWWWAGYFLERRGDPEEAEKAYRAAWKASELPEAAYHLGLLLGKAGKEKEALSFVELALQRNVVVRDGTLPPAEALITLAGMYVQTRNFERAVQILGVGAKDLTDHYRLQQNLGFCYRELGTQQNGMKKKSLARRSWRKAAQHYELASAAVRRADVDASVKAQVLNDTGLMFHYHLNQLAKGIRYYEEALELDPGYIDAVENMGVVMLKRKKWAKAIEWFDKVLAKQPKRGTSLKGKQAAEEMLAARRRK